jgi:hypothetical protein
MLTRINLLRIVWVFLFLALVENLGFPYMANHGHFDLSNEGFTPYLRLAFFVLIELILLSIIILKKPSPNTVMYNIGKVILPMSFVTLIINTYGLIPIYWGAFSTFLFALQILVIVFSLVLSINFLRNKSILS